jgi:anti-sigma factor RsiW
VTCRDVIALVSDYLAGELPPEVTAAFDAHLHRCLNCRTFLAQLRITIEAGRLVATSPEDADGTGAMPAELLASILALLRTGNAT